MGVRCKSSARRPPPSHIRSNFAEVEKWTFLAVNGHLTPAERARVAERGREARNRVGTPGEHKAALLPDYGGDKEAVAVAEAVEAA